MNRIFSFALIVLTTVFGYVLYKQQDIGHITIELGSFNIETSLLVFGSAIFALLFVALVLLGVVARLNNGASMLVSVLKNYFAGKSKHALSDSLIDIAEGRYEKAEKRLLGKIKHCADPFPLYIAAATAAQGQDAHDRRDEYLQLAHNLTQSIAWSGDPKTQTAIGLIKAGFQLDNNQPEQAISVLTSLETISPKHTRVLTLLADAYHRLSRWGQLRELTSKLYKNKALPDDKIESLEIEAWQGLINDNTSDENSTLLRGLWDEMPAHLKASNELLELYTRALMHIKLDDDAARILQHGLNHGWQDSLVVLFSQLNLSADDALLETTEGWLNQHPDNAPLLLALGKMCMKLSLWGKARSYFEASLAIDPLPETCLKLAILLEQHMDEAEGAQDYYQKGLHLLINETIPVTVKGDSQQNQLKPQLKIVSPK